MELAIIAGILIAWFIFRSVIKLSVDHLSFRTKVAIASDRADCVEQINAISAKSDDIKSAKAKLEELLA